MDSISLAAAHQVPILNDQEWKQIVTTQTIPPRVRKLVRATQTPENLERVAALLERYHISILTESDQSYPDLLRESVSPPPLLYIRGNIEAARRGGVAIVGSRKATSYGLRVTRSIVQALAPLRVPIISGLAYGIDAAAHTTALESGTPTVAVFGCGIDEIYPYVHTEVAEKIITQGGALISEFPLGARPLPRNFPRRNRIIAGLAQATVVVEAAERSGSLVTAKFAVEANRDLWVVPGPITSELSAGPLSWLKLGATPLLHPRDLAARFGETNSAPQPVFPRDPTLQQILEFLKDGPRHIDEIILSCTLEPSTANASLNYQMNQKIFHWIL
jgi:DNA processing protein